MSQSTPIHITLVNLIRPHNGPVKSVSIGLITERIPESLLNMFTFLSTEPADHDNDFDSLLIQSLLYSEAFSKARDSSYLQSYLRRQSNEMNFSFHYDVSINSYKIKWKKSFVCDPVKVGACFIDKIITLFLSSDTC